MNKIIYCGNCNKKGHVYKNCNLPITSNGIICIKYPEKLDKIISSNFISNNDENYKNVSLNIRKNLKFLIICRKHSYSFIEIFRGLYEINNIDYIIELFNRLALKEYIFISKNMHNPKNLFNRGWRMIWNNKANEESLKNEYNTALNKFIQLIEIYPTFINKIKIKYKHPEWEFPKGKRNIRESDFQCANREFIEETNFNSEDYEILNILPISEVFIGNNNVKYKYNYYLAQILNDDEPSIGNENQKIEISMIKWCNIDEIISKIRPYNKERISIIKKIYNFIIKSINDKKNEKNISYDNHEEIF